MVARIADTDGAKERTVEHDDGQPILSTLARGLRIVELLTAEESLTVREVAALLSTSRSSAYRLIRTLVESRWLTEIEPGVYEAGPALLALSTRVRGQSYFRKVAHQWMRKLKAETAETITLSVRVDNWRMAIEQLESDRDVRMSVELGRRLPLYAGASGRAILSGLSPDELDNYLDSVTFEPITGRTVTDRTALRAVIAQSRADGCTVSMGERDPDAFAIAAPVLHDRIVLGAVAICGPISRYDPVATAQWKTLLCEAVAQISHALRQRSTGQAAGAARERVRT